MKKGRKRICILGSTGSIGKNALEVIRSHADLFEVTVLVARVNASVLIEQALSFRPSVVVIGDETKRHQVASALEKENIKVLAGEKAIEEVVVLNEVDFVLNSMVGFSGLKPTIAALTAQKVVGLANKETLVVAGELITSILQKTNASLIPIDSEHSAIFQCMQGEDANVIHKLILTASGGPFRTTSLQDMEAITVEQALKHPNWSMGEKITIDSATMMNKGLEIIEAHWLFDIPPSKIQVVVHPQSIIHSMVEYVDGSLKAQLGLPDMKVPIQYALSYPKRLMANYPRLDWSVVSNFTFELPDYHRFPCLKLAYEALEIGGTASLVLNAANEVAVALFLKKEISFLDIPKLIEKSMSEFAAPAYQTDVNAMVEIDRKVRAYAKQKAH